MLIKIQRFIDKYFIGLLNILFSLLKFYPNKNKYLKKPKKILVIRLWALGSSLLTMPAIKQLKDFYGNKVQIDLLATNRNLIVFKNQGYFKNTFNLFSLKDLFKLFFKFKNYDIVIDFEEYFNISSFFANYLGKNSSGWGDLFTRRICYTNPVNYQAKHQVEAFLDLLKPFGIKTYKLKNLEKLVYQNKDKIKVNDFLKKYSGKIKICMHTAGAETSLDRFWSIEKWKDLIEKITKKYGDKIVIFLSGTDFEKKQVNNLLSMLNIKDEKQVVSIVNKFNLFEFAYFLENCNLMISNDTGPMHLACAMGTKTIGLFGPNLPERYGAYPLDKNINLYKGDGKIYVRVQEGIFEEDKEKNIDKIRVEDVYKVIEKEIGKKY